MGPGAEGNPRNLPSKGDIDPSNSGTKKVPRIRALEILVLEMWTLTESLMCEVELSEPQAVLITRIRKLVAHERDTEGKSWPDS